jgi:regulator of protease activity HflC (stomatin/prohibitin superfamily)
MDMTYVLAILGLALVLYLMGSLRLLRQYEHGVVFLLGKFKGVRGPGLNAVSCPLLCTIHRLINFTLASVEKVPAVPAGLDKGHQRVSGRHSSRPQ